MLHSCTRCGRPFGSSDVARGETDDMEADRAAAGLRGVRFHFYSCSACGTDDIFVDLLPLRGELPERFLRRRAEMEAVVRALHVDAPASCPDVVVAAASGQLRHGR
jgi:hypothetical protein